MAKNKKDKSKESEKGKSGSKVMILIVLLLVLLIGAISFTGYIFLTKDKDAEEKIIIENVYDLGTFSVNLADEERMRYAKVSISLGYDSEIEMEPVLTQNDKKLKDFVNGKLMSKKSEELKSDGIPVLKKEILDGINKLLVDQKILNVYITEVLVQ